MVTFLSNDRSSELVVEVGESSLYIDVNVDEVVVNPASPSYIESQRLVLREQVKLEAARQRVRRVKNKGSIEEPIKESSVYKASYIISSLSPWKQQAPQVRKRTSWCEGCRSLQERRQILIQGLDGLIYSSRILRYHHLRSF
jgi:hypothetical protein